MHILMLRFEHRELAGDRSGFILHTHQWAEQTTDDRAKYYCKCTEPKLLLQFQLLTDLFLSLKAEQRLCRFGITMLAKHTVTGSRVEVLVVPCHPPPVPLLIYTQLQDLL